ncbi:helix-turn-helix transcriptional regulator [uncultured Lactobacillus sp.]|uniref:helix-turn-helix domain-containing protein n=1 Tax=uncultured Lactobacillus sp. TaxID=153152 RepID=UPI0025D33398|nr:helix-turn-helix transcriptional regulator [uncultured Lactobacillus sp.]
MNYIGNKLKALRQELGLTQTEMAAGVISVSFYSKVERGLNDIGVNDFLEILHKHNVDPKEFFGNYKTKEYNREKITVLVNKFIKVAYDGNISEICKVTSELEEINPQTPFIKFIVLATRLIANTHDEKTLNNLTDDQKKEIKKIIFQKDTDENEYYRIILMANLIQIYSMDSASFFVNNMIRKYQNFSKIDKNTLLALSILMINYIDWCIKKDKKELCYDALSYLKQMPNYIELAFTKILGNYYKDLYKGKRNKAKNVLEVLTDAGYEVNATRMVNNNFQF